jgi:hypothetical protein
MISINADLSVIVPPYCGSPNLSHQFAPAVGAGVVAVGAGVVAVGLGVVAVGCGVVAVGCGVVAVGVACPPQEAKTVDSTTRQISITQITLLFIPSSFLKYVRDFTASTGCLGIKDYIYLYSDMTYTSLVIYFKQSEVGHDESTLIETGIVAFRLSSHRWIMLIHPIPHLIASEHKYHHSGKSIVPRFIVVNSCTTLPLDRR